MESWNTFRGNTNYLDIRRSRHSLFPTRMRNIPKPTSFGLKEVAQEQRLASAILIWSGRASATDQMARLRHHARFFLRLGKRVRELRSKNGFSQEDMTAYGFSARHWQQILRSFRGHRVLRNFLVELAGPSANRALSLRLVRPLGEPRSQSSGNIENARDRNQST